MRIAVPRRPRLGPPDRGDRAILTTSPRSSKKLWDLKWVGAAETSPDPVSPVLPATYACSWPPCIICSASLSPSSAVMVGTTVMWKWSSQSARSARMGSTLSAS